MKSHARSGRGLNILRKPEASIALLFIKDLGDLLFLLNNLRRLGQPLSENVSFDEPGQPHGQFMTKELACWDRENLCE